MAELSTSVEQEIAELEKALAAKKRILEEKHAEGTIEAVPHAKEILREVLKEKITATPPRGLPPSPQPSPAPLQPPVPAEPPSYFSEEMRPKIQELAKIAFEESLMEAIKIVKAANNAALLDAFHDYMVDELYTYLVESGKLEQVS